MSDNYYISGIPRSGSTLLFNILKQNPELSDITKGRHWGTDESLPDLMMKKTPKILVTYRPILEVLASFIKLAEQYPQVNFIDKFMMEQKFPSLSYRPINDSRCDWLMRPHGAIDMVNSVFKNTVIHKEIFTDTTTKNIRENERVLEIENPNDIIKMATTSGFIVKGKVSMDSPGEYLYIFERLN